MARTSKLSAGELDDAVIACYIHPNTGREETTPAERQEVAARWCEGNFEYHHEVATKHGLLPIALLIAALIDIEHPLVMRGTNALNSLQCAMEITTVMLKRETVAQPVNSLHRLPVERIET
jgi:hypothetical protein